MAKKPLAVVSHEPVELGTPERVTISFGATAVYWSVTATSLERAAELFEQCREKYGSQPGYRSKLANQKDETEA